MGNIKIYNIKPLSKPRMTKRDRWAKRPCVLRYFAYRDDVKAKGVELPKCNYHVIFVLPMPKSWSKKKKIEYMGKPHQQRPDKDNLEKGLLDAVYKEDATIWDGRVSKIWGKSGSIIVLSENMVEDVRITLDILNNSTHVKQGEL